MNQHQPAATAPRPAAAISREVELGDEARRLLQPNQSASAYFELLCREELFPDAVRFVAHLLPLREAVWWGCLCAWNCLRPSPAAAEANALQAAVNWVLDPTEENRQAAAGPARAAGLNTAAGCVAMAAFWSGGSMSKPDLPQVPPPPGLAARTVANAVLLAARKEGPAWVWLHYRRFLRLAIEVDSGTNRWA